MLAQFGLSFRPWIALRSWLSSRLYSAFSVLDLAVTVTFSIEKAHLVESVTTSTIKVLGVAPSSAYPDRHRGQWRKQNQRGSSAGFVPDWLVVPRPVAYVGHTTSQVESRVLTGECGIDFVEECLVTRLVVQSRSHAKISPVGPFMG